MYTEENEKKRFPFRDFLLKVMLVIIFAFLLVWLVPKFIGGNDKSEENKETNTTSETTSEVFQQNLDEMKDAAIDYYTNDNLPTVDGRSRTISLQDMIDEDLLSPIKDKDNKTCDAKKSYAQITKDGDEYVLEVSLTCPSEEDSVSVYLGNYANCEDNICEKEAEPTTSNNNSTTTTTDNNETNTSNGTSTQSNNKTVETNQSSGATSSSNNNHSSNTSGNNSSNTNNNQSSNNNSSSSNNGNNNSSTTKPTTTVLYEYRKDTAAVFSSWSSWSAWQKNTQNLKYTTCSDTDESCLRRIKLTSRKEQIGDYGGTPLYGMVEYYSEQTRRLISPASTSLKWSKYNDTSLLNAGYRYTGNIKTQ